MPGRKPFIFNKKYKKKNVLQNKIYADTKQRYKIEMNIPSRNITGFLLLNAKSLHTNC